MGKCDSCTFGTLLTEETTQLIAKILRKINVVKSIQKMAFRALIFCLPYHHLFELLWFLLAGQGMIFQYFFFVCLEIAPFSFKRALKTQLVEWDNWKLKLIATAKRTFTYSPTDQSRDTRKTNKFLARPFAFSHSLKHLITDSTFDLLELSFIL